MLVKDFVEELCKPGKIAKYSLSDLDICKNDKIRGLPYVVEKGGTIYFKIGDTLSPVFNLMYKRSFFLKRVKNVTVSLCNGEGLENYMEEDLMPFMRRQALSYHYEECGNIEDHLERLRKDKEQALILLAEEKAKVNMLLSD